MSLKNEATVSQQAAAEELSQVTSKYEEKIKKIEQANVEKIAVVENLLNQKMKELS